MTSFHNHRCDVDYDKQIDGEVVIARGHTSESKYKNCTKPVFALPYPPHRTAAWGCGIAAFGVAVLADGPSRLSSHPNSKSSKPPSRRIF